MKNDINNKYVLFKMRERKKSKRKIVNEKNRNKITTIHECSDYKNINKVKI